MPSTAAITGACVAVTHACQRLIEAKLLKALPIRKFVAAVSVGIVAGQALLDLNYVEDKDASVDMNLVMTEDGNFVEVQGSGEENTFTQEEFTAMLEIGRKGIAEMIVAQKAVLGLQGNSPGASGGTPL